MPLELVNKINDLLGIDMKIMEVLRNRKGFGYKVEGQGMEMLLKIIELKPDDEDMVPRIRSQQKEAWLLRKLRDFTGELYVGSGELDGYFWLLRKWLQGETALKYTAYIRKHPQLLENKRRFVCDLCKMLDKVIELEQIGYLHGDLQPGHFIIDPSGKFHLIDLELAVKKNDPDAIYRGALVHFVSPETASGMLVQDHKIPLDPISEVYSFGAVVFYMYTKVVPVAYGETMEDPSYKDIPFEKKSKAVAQGKVRSFAQAGAEPFPELEAVLMKCLDRDRSKRYQSFESLKIALHKLLSSIKQ